MSKALLIRTLVCTLLLMLGIGLAPLRLSEKVLAIALTGALALLLLAAKNLQFFIVVIVQRAKLRRREMFDRLRGRAVDVVMLGDSITHEGLWHEYFPELALVNRGIGGDTTRDILDRLDAIHPLQPKRILLLIGINDFNMGSSREKLLANYEQILSNLQQQLPATQVFVQSILPVSAAWPLASNGPIRATNEQLQVLAARFGYPYVDLHSRFCDERGELRAELSNDGIHLRQDGYGVWCEVVRPLLVSSPNGEL